MNPRLLIAIVAFTACAAFAIGWNVEYRRTRGKPGSFPGNSAGNPQSMQSASDCGTNALDIHWYTVQTLFYKPIKTLYMTEWQFCPGEGGRVRVTDANFGKVFYEYEDDVILRVESVELGGNHAPQLLIVTGSSGTNDRINWHVLSEVNGQLQEWKWPNYDGPARELLGPDEDFCCKEWNFHLRAHDIVLARGIYHKGEDGNCCPSRGGVIVRLKPIENGFKLDGVQRINRSEYDRLRSQPFCSQCTLAGP